MDFWLDYYAGDWILGLLQEENDLIQAPVIEDLQKPMRSFLKGHDSCRIYGLVYPDAFKSTNQRIRKGAQALSRLLTSKQMDIRVEKLEIISWFRFRFEDVVKERNRDTSMGLLKWNGVLFCLLLSHDEPLSFIGAPDRYLEMQDLLRFSICMSQMDSRISDIYAWGLSEDICAQMRCQDESIVFHQVKDGALACIETDYWERFMAPRRKKVGGALSLRWRRVWSLLIWALALSVLGGSVCLWQERERQDSIACLQTENMKVLKKREERFLEAFDALSQIDAEETHRYQKLNAKGLGGLLNDLRTRALSYSPLTQFREMKCERAGEAFRLHLSLRIYRTAHYHSDLMAETFLRETETYLETDPALSLLQLRVDKSDLGYDDFCLEVLL